MSSLEDMSLEALRTHRVHTFRQGAGTRPEVSLVRVGEEQAVLKDYSHSDPWFRRLAGPLLAYREARALRMLAGVEGVPRLIRRLGRLAVLMEYVPGKTTKELKKEGGVDPAVFDRIYSLVDAIHARQVAHCDLRSGGNTVITAEGQPYFVDFVGHFVRGRPWNLLWAWAFDKFCIADRIAVARLKSRLAPEQLTETERHHLELDRSHPIGRIARAIGRTSTWLSRKLLTRKS